MIDKYKINLLIVLGAENSSNSNRLRDIGNKYSIPAYLLNDSSEIREDWITSEVSKIGITAGASAPEILVEGVIEFFKNKFPKTIITLMDGVKEDTVFHLPKEVR
jgi:4-hydroxy-3-methylbut-2-enyl diphosphate reductase